jgi:hypothetical protein
MNSMTAGFMKVNAQGAVVMDTNTYLTGVTSGQVTGALGYTPYNSSNPSGYVNSSNWAILSGATSYNTDRTTKVSNGLAIYSAYSGGANSPTTYDISAQYVVAGKGMEMAASWHSPSATMFFRTLRDCCDNWSSWVTMLSSANFNSYALPLTGGTLSGNLYVTNSSTVGAIFLSGAQSGARQYMIQNGITGISNSGLQIRDVTGNASLVYFDTSYNASFGAGIWATSGNFSAAISASNISSGVNASHIVQRDGNGYIYANHINFNTPESENPAISSFITSNGDGWSRKSSLAHVRNQLGNYGGWITSSGSITGNAATATYATNATRLYASDGSYVYGGAAPYYMTMTYDGSRWLLQVTPGTPAAVRVSYADSAGSASSASTSSQVTINYNNDSNSTYQLLWGSGNSVYGTAQVYVNPSSDIIYARGGYISPGNAWGTGDSAFFPNGITTAGGTNWVYGSTYIGNAPGNGYGVEIRSNGSAYFLSSTTSGTWGYAGQFVDRNNAGNNYIPWSFESEYGNHSWGIVARFHIQQSGADKPSLQFTATGSNERWSIGYVTGSDYNFRITQNHGYRTDNSTNDGWGTERFRINTDGTTYLGIQGQIVYFNGAESANLYGIRGRFTNEFIHLYQKVGVGHPGGWGQGEGNTPTQGLSTYGGITIAYGTGGTSTFHGHLRVTGNNNLYLDSNFGQSIVGLYSASRYQGVFAMGDAYKLPVDGTSTGSLYGLAWSHPNAGGVAGNLNTHGLLVMENGTFLAAVSGSIRARDDMRAPIFYDQNDTTYYLDLNSTSDSAMRIRGGALFGPNTTWGASLYVGGNGRVGTSATVAVTNGNLHMDSQDGYQMYLNWYSGTPVWTGGNLGVGSASASHRLHVHGTGFASSDFRAPIFYDSENTGFYLDPNGTSNLNQLTTNTRAKWNMPRWWMSREDYTSDQNYWTGTNGWGTSGGTWANAWRGGFSGWDIWGTGTDHPQGGGYVHAQGIVSGQHLATSDGSSGYGWMMVGAADAVANRYWLRGKWSTTTSGWVEMITTGNIGGQSVSYATSAGNASTVGGYAVAVGGSANTIPTRNGSGYLIPENWIQLNGIYGLYSPTNNAHLRPNDASYGSWLMTGTRNGWQGIEFNSGGAGNVTMMISADSNTSGFHNNSYGWQIRWANGTLFCGKNSYGGNDATVWDSSNAPRASNSHLMYYQGFTLNADTMDVNATGFTYAVNAPYVGPIVRFSTGGGYDLWLNAAYGGSGNLIAFRTRNGDSATLNPWREFITSGNIGNQSVSYANNAGNVSSISGALNGNHTWTNINYFLTNNGGYLGSTNTAKLQAFSYDNNSAFMSFHKSSHYAVNFGLDADNVMRIGGWSASANRWQLDMSGNMTVAGDVTAYSDARVKENVETIVQALDKVLQLRGVSYNRTDSDDKKTKIGVIAQETLVVVPEVVNQDNTGMYNVSYGNLAGLFIEAIKEQQKQIEDLKSKLDALTK